MPSLCIAVVRVTVNYITIVNVSPKCLWRICIAGDNNNYLRLYVECPIFLSDFNQFEISRQIFIKVPGIKFHGNLSIGSRFDTCKRTHRQTNMTIRIGDFRYYSKAPKQPVAQLVKKFLVFIKPEGVFTRVCILSLF